DRRVGVERLLRGAIDLVAVEGEEHRLERRVLVDLVEAQVRFHRRRLRWHARRLGHRLRRRGWLAGRRRSSVGGWRRHRSRDGRLLFVARRQQHQRPYEHQSGSAFHHQYLCSLRVIFGERPSDLGLGFTATSLETYYYPRA